MIPFFDPAKDNPPLVSVWLHGPLADRYGSLHRLAVKTPIEAVAALDANYPGFVADFARHGIYHIHADGDWRDGDEAASLPFGREVHLVPVVEGRAFLGAALVGTLIPALAGTTAATIIGGLLVTGLLIGVSMLLAPKKETPQEDKRDENYAFTGPENTTQQGVPVPLIYGRVHAGSAVVSAGLELATLAASEDDTALAARGDGAAPGTVQEDYLRIPESRRPIMITGAAGKEGGSGAPSEAPDNLKSRQIAKVVDLLSEGPIRGVVGGSKGIFLDGVALQNPSGSFNYQNVIVQLRNGYPAQSIMNGFASQQSEQAVGVQLKQDVGITRTITNPDVDRVRVTVSVPSLQVIDKETGDIGGSSITFRIWVQAAGGGYRVLGDYTISGKTTSNYQYAVSFAASQFKPFDVRLQRLTADSTTNEIQNDLFWDSYTEIIDDRVNYTLSACVGIQIDAEQFRTIPKRVYLTDGLIVRIPSNYDPDAATYTGVWDGTFAFNWTNNPAWVLYDLVVNRRYGIGEFITPPLVDKWALYAIGQWCDQRVADGKGGQQRRWTCNCQILDQQDAFDLLQQIASIFRGFTYWNGSMLVPVADQPANPVIQYTNANAIDGQFTYSGTDRRARHTQVAVGWRDPEQLGETRLAIVEDQEAIGRFGLQTNQVTAFGCNNEAEAIRTGKWMLFTEQYEGEAVTFRTGLEGAWARPGDIVRIADINVAGKRRGGRVIAGATATSVPFDADAGALTPGGGGLWLSCVVGEGVVESRPVTVYSGTAASVGTPFSFAPQPDTVFILTETADLEPTLWRALAGKQLGPDEYEISAIRHYPSKWDYVEKNKALTIPDVSDIVAKPPAATDLKVLEYLVQTSPISVGVRVTFSWISKSPLFDVYYRKEFDNWQHVRTDQNAVDLAVTEGAWTFQVVPVGTLGIKGPVSTLNYSIIGRFAPPAAPKQFRVVISDGIALFRWAPATDLDVIIGGHFELRYSAAASGATWNSAQTILPSIPGTATSVEALYRPGTYLLRTFDIVGMPSTDAAIIISTQPDGRYNEYARVCENPDFLGDHNYTEVLEPQQWLVIGQTGGLWDGQLANMDSWPNVDVLVEGMPVPPQSAPRHGWYLFEDRIDAGGVFTVRFSADILAFPYAEGSEFIDDRLNDCDDWVDWDDVEADLSGQVQLYIRTTQQDPASAGAQWTDWQIFAPQEYTARGFEFRADLYAPLGQNIGVEELCIIADLRMKMDSAEDVPYPAATTHVTFKVKFYLPPSVVVTVQDALATDTIQVLNKTREGFDLKINNPPPTQVTRVFDWQARGF